MFATPAVWELNPCACAPTMPGRARRPGPRRSCRTGRRARCSRCRSSRSSSGGSGRSPARSGAPPRGCSRSATRCGAPPRPSPRRSPARRAAGTGRRPTARASRTGTACRPSGRPRPDARPPHGHEMQPQAGHAAAQPVLDDAGAAHPDRVRSARPVNAHVPPPGPAGMPPDAHVHVGAASPRQFSPTRLKGLGATILAVAPSGAFRSKSAVRGAAKALETGRNAHRNAADEAGSFTTAPTPIAGRRLRAPRAVRPTGWARGPASGDRP